MIGPGITLQEVDAIYQRMGVKELFILPWHEDGKVVGLITGAIEVINGSPGLSAFLEHIIVLPEAKQKLRVMQEMPKMAAGLAMAAGARRIVLCIGVKDPRNKRLATWARRAGYTRYKENHNDRDWYVLELYEETEP